MPRHCRNFSEFGIEKHTMVSALPHKDTSLFEKMTDQICPFRLYIKIFLAAL